MTDIETLQCWLLWIRWNDTDNGYAAWTAELDALYYYLNGNVEPND